MRPDMRKTLGLVGEIALIVWTLAVMVLYYRQFWPQLRGLVVAIGRRLGL